MNRTLSIVVLAVAVVIALNSAWAQSPFTAGQANPADNAASATKDTSGTSSDQVTKPAGAKGSTIIGCLGGPNLHGNYILTSMQHRTGIEVVGPEDLKDTLGSKVKLTGNWQPIPAAQPDQPAENGAATSHEKKETRRFQVTQFEVLAQRCDPPSQTSPGKNK